MKTASVAPSHRMHYETPREGITIGGYLARRLHKTTLLKPVAELVRSEPARALAQLAIYAAAASTSFGPALYQPASDPDGRVIDTIDPETGARVVVTCEGNLRFSYRVDMPGVGILTGAETITGTTVGWRGLGMPAPTTFRFSAEQGDYAAEMTGLITSELGPGLRGWSIRGYGALDLSDNQGNRGRLSLDRSGWVMVGITTQAGSVLELKNKLV